MRKKVVYLGIGFVILGIVLVCMGLFMMTDSGLYILSGNYETFNSLVLARSIMNWLGIIFSIGGAVAIIVGIYLDEQLQNEKKIDSINQDSKEKQFVTIKPSQHSDKTGYCFQCGEKIEGKTNYCFICGTKLR